MSAQMQKVDPRSLLPIFARTRKVKLGSFKNVANNVTDVFQLPLGPTYHKLSLHCKTSAGGNVAAATIANDISALRIKVNGNTKIEMTPSFGNIIKPYYGDYKGAGTVAGVCPIPLMERHLNNPAAVLQTSWGTGDIDGLTLEVDFGTLTTTTGLDGGVVDVYASIEDVVAPLGLHRCIRQVTKAANNTGETEFYDLPRDGILAYRAIHINDSGYASYYRIKRNTSQERDNIPTVIDQEDIEDSCRNPQSNYRHIDFNLSNELFGGLAIMSNPAPVTSLLAVVNYTTAPNSHTWFLETLESFAPRG